MTTLLIVGFGASFTGFVTSLFLMYKLLTSKYKR